MQITEEITFSISWLPC